MSSWVGNPDRPPYVIPRGSAGLKKRNDQRFRLCNGKRRKCLLILVFCCIFTSIGTTRGQVIIIVVVLVTVVVVATFCDILIF